MNDGKNISAAIASAVVLGSTFNGFADSAVGEKMLSYDLTSNFNKIEPEEIPGNIIKKISTEWMLITAGSDKNFNGMTASWGGIGFWNKPMAFILVHTERNTYKFVEQNDYFTLSFFDEKYRPALMLFGTKSGRDMDKTKEAGLTGISTKPGIAYAEAKLIIVCRKDFSTMTTPNNPPNGHKLYFGEIIAVWQKK